MSRYKIARHRKNRGIARINLSGLGSCRADYRGSVNRIDEEGLATPEKTNADPFPNPMNSMRTSASYRQNPRQNRDRHGFRIRQTMVLTALVCLFVSCERPPVIDLDQGFVVIHWSDSEDELSGQWTPESVTPMPSTPIYPDTWLERSKDFLNWETVGETVVGGVDHVPSSQKFTLPRDEARYFYRVSGRVELPEANLAGQAIRNANLSRANLRGAVLSGAELTDVDFIRANLRNASLKNTFVRGSNFSGADLTEADLAGITVIGPSSGPERAHVRSDFSDASLQGANVRAAVLPNSRFVKANLKNSELNQANLSGSDFSGANLSGAILVGTDLTGANLTGANLDGANLSGAILNGVNFRNAIITGATRLSEKWIRVAGLQTDGVSSLDAADSDLSHANLEGVDFSDLDLSGFTLRGANLKYSDLSGANLEGANLTDARLAYANFRGTRINANTQLHEDYRLVWRLVNDEAGGTNLENKRFSNSDLNHIDLSDRNLASTSFESSWLRFANFRSAKLPKAFLKDADLTGADLRGADLGQARLSGAILTGALFDDDTIIDPKWRTVSEILTHPKLGRDLAGTDLSDANLQAADLRSANLQDVDFSKARLEHARLEGANLIGANLYRAELANAHFDSDTKIEKKWLAVWEAQTSGQLKGDWSGQELKGIHIEASHLNRVGFQGADLSDARFSQSHLIGSDFRNANLTGARFNHANAQGTRFTGATLENASFDGADLVGADFQNANLSQANLGTGLCSDCVDFSQPADLRTANLQGANLTLTSLREVDLRGANLTGAILDWAPMLNVRISETTLLDPKARLIIDLQNSDSVDPSRLANADLSRTHLLLEDEVFAGADLQAINFSEAHLLSITFDEANMDGANLSDAINLGERYWGWGRTSFQGTSLKNADFSGAQLQETDFMRADLSGADFTGTDLAGCNFTGAILQNANFAGANLCGAIGFTIRDEVSVEGAILPNSTNCGQGNFP